MKEPFKYNRYEGHLYTPAVEIAASLCFKNGPLACNSALRGQGLACRISTNESSRAEQGTQRTMT
jgi:hypothetical protein